MRDQMRRQPTGSVECCRLQWPVFACHADHDDEASLRKRSEREPPLLTAAKEGIIVLALITTPKELDADRGQHESEEGQQESEIGKRGEREKDGA